MSCVVFLISKVDINIIFFKKQANYGPIPITRRFKERYFNIAIFAVNIILFKKQAGNSLIPITNFIIEWDVTITILEVHIDIMSLEKIFNNASMSEFHEE
jgi:hypothetical protein